MASVVKYSPRAARALAFLKRFYNDIDIYIEDVTCHNMALFIFRNSLGADVRLSSVNQLGGRSEVIKACRLDQLNDGRKKLYVIDGDLDLLAGAPKPKLKHLYRLRGYCFENLIITNAAVVELATECAHNTPPHRLEALLDQPRWIAATTSALISLFILYAVARRLSPSTRTVAFSVFQLCDQTAAGPVLSKQRIRSRMLSLVREILAHSDLVSVRATRKEVAARAAAYSPSDFVISGKDYLAPLLRLKLREQANFNGNMDDLKVRLARFYDGAREPYLTRRLRMVAGL